MAQPSNVFVDIIRGKHLAGTPEQLLERRRLTWSKEYGWVYDVWAEDARKYSQAGAYGRYFHRLLGGWLHLVAISSRRAADSPSQLSLQRCARMRRRCARTEAIWRKLCATI
jgi:hypothetical protein